MAFAVDTMGSLVHIDAFGDWILRSKISTNGVIQDIPRVL